LKVRFKRKTYEEIAVNLKCQPHLSTYIPCFTIHIPKRTYLDLLFYRLPDKEEEQTESYVKDNWFEGIHGQCFEYKYCGLAFLRATKQKKKFKLASHMKGLGVFDEVIVERLHGKSKKSHIFMQIKRITRQSVTTEKLLAKKGHFSLRKYYDAYMQFEEKFIRSEEGVKLECNIDESLFILYTNADVASYLQSNKPTNIGEEKFLMTGGSVLQFNEKDHPAIYKHLQELPKYREFLSRFRIFYSQANEKDMDRLIKGELQQIMKLPESELDIAYLFFIDYMKDWWQNGNFFLKDTNSRENDPLRKTSEFLRNIINKIRGIPNLTNSALNTNSPQ
jgi:hypothetical protein